MGVKVIDLRIIPILLMHNGGLVKGVHFKNHRYIGDPMNTIRIFNEKNVDELFLLDIDATKKGTIPDIDFIQRIADECYMPFGVGGGIKTVKDIRALLRAGAEKVSINTAAVENPQLIKNASDIFGSQSVVVSIDVKRTWLGQYVVYTHSGKRKTDKTPVALAREAEQLGAGELLINSIERDGSFKGYDLRLISKIAASVNIPVIACGGADCYDNLFRVVEQTGATAAAAGSLFVFYGAHRGILIQYPDGISYPRNERHK
jgi:cyclase